MGSASRFSALNTKLQAMEGKLLKNTDYNVMMELKSVVEIAEYLKNKTHYKNVLEDYNMEMLRRADLEYLLEKEIAKEFKKTIWYFKTNYKKFMKAVMLRFEVFDIQLILRALTKGEDIKVISNKFIHEKEFENVSFEKLLIAKSFQDTIEVFEGTIYEDAFRNITEEDLRTRQFHAEMNLDQIYFNNLLKLSKGLIKEDSKIVQKLIGINIDLFNVQWIYRSKNYYKLMNEEILNYALSGGYKLKFKVFKNLVYSDDFSESLKKIVKIYYDNIFNTDDIYTQISIYHYFFGELKKEAKKFPLTIATSIKYIHSLEYEIMDIISIIEGIRYGSNNIKDFLIRTI